MLSPGTVRVLNDPDLLAARRRHVERLRAMTDGVQEGPYQRLWGVNGTSERDPHADPEGWIDEALESLVPSAEGLLDDETFRPVCIEFGPWGVHFVDRVLGAEVYWRDGLWWSDELDVPVGSLPVPDLETDPTWSVARRAAERFVQSGVSLPFFGMPTLSSALNVAINVHGERFLEAVACNPDAARRDLAVIDDLIRRMHRWFRARVPADQLQPVVAAFRCQPPGRGQLCGCSTQLLSAAQYRDLIAPLDDALLREYPEGGMIHLCGRHTHHMPVWREIRSLRAVQLNDTAAEDLDEYASRLRPDQVIYLNPTEIMHEERAMALVPPQRLVLVADVSR